jgi:regulator of sigma E protease
VISISTVLYILLAVFIFGVLIFVHEGGHFLFARLFHVSIREFAIGMGPKLLTRTSKKSGIAYSLRLFPIGGFVSMVGEDEESDDPNAFNKKKVWQRLIIVSAGAIINILLGVIITSVLVCAKPVLGSTVVAEFAEGSVSYEAGLQIDDEIIRVDGQRVHIADELMYEIMRLGIEPVDLTVIRDGEEVVVKDVEFPIMSESGTAFGNQDFKIYAERPSVGNIAKHCLYRSTYTVRMIWESLYDLVTGRYGIQAVSGPVGVTEVLTEAAQTSSFSFFSLIAIITINLGVVNLLPLPALDGGRLIFLIIEGIRRKPIKPEIEGYIHFAGLAVLMLFMVVICVKDIIGLF